MVYKVHITEHASNLLDALASYLLLELQNEQAAVHLLNGIECIYERLSHNPFQFPISKDTYLAHKRYHETIVPQMNYIIIFNIQDDTVNVLGIFHQLENYHKKI